ncbi:DEAD/DEAH box helicase [Lactococcus garvieae]|uniref:DEAD-box ATP-dependent RNA helicase CshA n=2 Tax=Lactococcus garvieae TaxID=1363 RepID=A0A1I4G6G1_9LACT|nr:MULTISPECIES: DEAD/DEAH box helicase [Lactococcus]ETD05326.1 RNA helicase [Lactococcus garvieae TRF1]MDH7959899.1 DEAD/DEAH box helicase [Lactococcus garvieae]UYT10608.1 DEAD/DEAH box helicase [Lactococcus garvieae]UYT12650.1 DEAD/DEAH box helicase [Lactococcus garvieae]SFL24867.1 ATP-dependent RNA helicase DeaD [Lactococcus garvieae]
MKFNELGLSEGIVETLTAIGYEQPTPIQEQTIQLALSGRDVLGQAQTGTGKTAAFGLPTIEKINPENKAIQALVIAPTRELAVQGQEELFRFGKSKGLKVRTVFGGSSIEKQIKALRSGAHIVVGTPGRMVDLLKRKALDLSHLETLILDEADEMLNMGFLEDIEFIIGKTPAERQTLLFSATMPNDIKKIGVKFMKNPEHIKVAAKEMTADRIDQYFIKTKEFEKFDVLTRLLDVERPELAIVFGRTKRRVDEITRGLKLRGYRAEGIHGDLDQNKRLRVLRDFKGGHLDILVATDVAARGLDISGVTHVYNYDITQDQESYVHRIGRTGRAGKSGRSVTFVSYNEMGYLRAIEKLTKKEMKGMRPPTKEDAYQASLSVAMDEIKRDLQDGSLKGKLTKFDADAEQLLAEYDVKELVAMLIQSRVKDPDTMPEVQITAERPLPFNGEGKGFKGKGKGGKGGGRYGRDRNNNNRGGRGGDRDGKGGYRGKGGDRDRDDKKRNWRDRDDKKRDYYKKDRKPKTQGSEKQAGFVMRNRGDK